MTAKRRLVIVVEVDDEGGGMVGDWSASTGVGSRLPVKVLQGRWMREGRDSEAPIALLSVGAAVSPRSSVRGRNGDGEQVICEVVQSLAYELF